MTSKAAMSGVLSLCGLLVCADAWSRPLFPYPASVVGDEPFHVLTTDLDGDGRLDLVSTRTDVVDVRVALGNGDGTFGAPTVYHVSQCDANCQPYATFGDFNSDGKTDLVVPIPGNDDEIAVLMGNGDGTFQPATLVLTGHNWTSQVAVGDFDHDGAQDLVTQWGRVLMGNGDGTFGSPLSAIATSARNEAVGDFDNDQLDDLAFAMVDSVVEVLLSNGDGTFDPAGQFPVGENPEYIVAGDLDNDEILDLAMVNRVNPSEISILFGNGDGTFGDLREYGTTSGTDPWYIAISDLDRNGLPDLVVCEWFRGVQVFFGLGGRQFAPPLEIEHDSGTGATFAIGDFDGDAIVDIAKPAWWANSVGVLYGRGDGSFLTGAEAAVGLDPIAAVTGDLNDDGRLDLVTVNSSSGDLSVLLADGASTFAPEIRLSAGTDPVWVAVGELTGDSHLDLVAANEGSNDLSLFPGNGDGTFSAPTSLPVGDPTPGTPSSVAVADLDADGRRDLIVAIRSASRIAVMLGNGDGTFGAQTFYVVGVGPSSLAVEDFNGDEIPDVAVANGGATTNTVSVLLGTGTGELAPASSFGAVSHPVQVVAGDIDGDLVVDLAVKGYNSSDLVFLGDGDGTFSSPVDVSLSGSSIALADFDADGRLDAVGDLMVPVRLGTVLGTFPPGSPGFEPPRFFMSVFNTFVVTGDFDLDQREDVAVLGDWLDSVLILPNQLGPTALVFSGTSTLTWPAVIGARTYDVYRGDLSALSDGDGDGLPDAGYGTCIVGSDDDARDTFFVDPANPAEGGGFFYLMSPVGEDGPGSLGTTSAGLARVPQIACP